MGPLRFLFFFFLFKYMDAHLTYIGSISDRLLVCVLQQKNVILVNDTDWDVKAVLTI